VADVAVGPRSDGQRLNITPFVDVMLVALLNYLYWSAALCLTGGVPRA